MNKKNVRDIDLKGERVVMRADFNVPLQDGRISDDMRITAALPTIKYILDNGASLVLLSHLGRPKGKVALEFSLAPVAARLSKLLGVNVKMADDCVGEKVVEMAKSLSPGEVILCENTRFHKAEDIKVKTDKDRELQENFARELAKLGSVYVNDAFGTAHRAHA
ncbi:MAG: phosphoglycerate kinase, partial [Victivallales bacterium]|nr:phosphoglycerate kinase [Victivallales bacterium]